MRNNFIDLIGQRFGRLIVIKRAPNDKYGNAMWLCRCNCGNEKIIYGYKLREGTTKSCSCLQKEVTSNRNRIKSGLANMRALIRCYKRSARTRGLEYSLTEQQFEGITQQDCFYCGEKPNNVHRSPKGNGDYVYNGLDRVDNTKGYAIDNVVPCCIRCNKAKGVLTLQDYKNWIKRSYNKLDF